MKDNNVAYSNMNIFGTSLNDGSQIKSRRQHSPDIAKTLISTFCLEETVVLFFFFKAYHFLDTLRNVLGDVKMLGMAQLNIEK